MLHPVIPSCRRPVQTKSPLGRAQAELCHAGDAPYRCFLPDLTRFGAPAAQDPGSSQRAPVIVSQRVGRHKIAPIVLIAWLFAMLTVSGVWIGTSPWMAGAWLVVIGIAALAVAQHVELGKPSLEIRRADVFAAT